MATGRWCSCVRAGRPPARQLERQKRLGFHDPTRIDSVEHALAGSFVLTALRVPFLAVAKVIAHNHDDRESTLELFRFGRAHCGPFRTAAEVPDVWESVLDPQTEPVMLTTAPRDAPQIAKRRFRARVCLYRLLECDRQPNGGRRQVHLCDRLIGP